MNTLRSLALRPLVSTDWPAVEAGFTHSFTDCRPPAIWDWRFQRQSPVITLSQGHSGMVVTDEDAEVAAFVGASHHRGWLYGQEIPLRRASDHFTHPRWRAQLSGRRGLFLQTETAYLTECLASGSLCLGIGLARRVRLGHLGGGLSHPYASGEWWRAGLTPPEQPGRSVQVRATDFRDSGWDELWQERRQQQRAGLIRDGAFLRWRFDDRQGRPYWRFALHHWLSDTPLGYVILTAAGPAQPQRAMLVDAVLPADLQQGRDAWGQISLWLQRRGVSEVITYAAPANPDYPRWPGLGFQRIAAPLPVAGVFLPTPQLPAAAFESDYTFTLADSDLF